MTGEKSYSYKRRVDASLVDALYLLVNSKHQKETIDAGKRIQVLMRVGRGGAAAAGVASASSGGADFSVEVVERVIKATSMVGLISLSLDLLTSLLREGCDTLPSAMCYTAVLNALRKNGRIDRLEETLTELANASRRIRRKYAQEGVQSMQEKFDLDSSSNDSNNTAIDIVAFNTYLASLCDAAVNQLPFLSTESVDMNIFDDGMSSFHIDVQKFNDSSPKHEQNKNQSNNTTSPSEKYLYKALNLLKHDNAKTKFSLAQDPDLLSYNTILTAAAKCSKNNNAKKFIRPVTEACLRWMNERGITGDVFTYNARIQVASASSTTEAYDSVQGHLSKAEKEAIKLIDELISDPTLQPDRYTINLALIPFLHAQRRDEIWHLLEKFYHSNMSSNNVKIITSGFEAFLNTLVKHGEVDFAREIFESFLLPEPMRKIRVIESKPKQRMQLSNEVKVMKLEATSYSTKDQQQQPPYGALKRPSPSTRHFNILLGGYSKSYQSALLRSKNAIFQDVNGTSNKNTLNFESRDDEAVSKPIDHLVEARKAYKLLDIMLEIGVPLDGFSLSSLMSFPSTTEQITALWKRIEPELNTDLNPAAYRSIITAYGRVGDASSASVVFEEMVRVCGNRGRSIECWNVLLGALAYRRDGEDGSEVLDVENAAASQMVKLTTGDSTYVNSDGTSNHKIAVSDNFTTDNFISLLHRKTFTEASIVILETMRNGTSIQLGTKLMHPPKPNSQTYCLVATTIANSLKHNSELALQLFQEAMDQGVTADGRFLNALLRCFGDDINGALAAWKGGIGAAAAKFEPKPNDNKQQIINRGANLLAAYNGLMHVCGRAIRPDVALRLAYAMQKTAGIEPTETTLNCYFAGKLLALSMTDEFRNFSFSMNQYESLLSVECTKYSSKDKRRAGDKKIRIIL